MSEKMGGKPTNYTTTKRGNDYIEIAVYTEVNFWSLGQNTVSFILKDDKVIETPHIPKQFK
jgi:hypothetical protein